MPLLINSAGVSAADPALRNLAIEYVFAASSMDIATIVGAWADTNNTFPGSNSILGGLSPASTIAISGATGSYDDTTKRLTIASTTGLSVGDFLYLSHVSIAAGLYKIGTIPVAGQITLAANPFNGLGNKTGVAYQNGWRYAAVLGTAPLSSSGAGQENFFKVRAQDSVGNQVDASDSIFIRDAPSGAAYVAIQAKTYDGSATTNLLNNTFDILGAWTNRGGVSHIALANHSTQSRNDFTWTTGGTTEKTTAAAIAAGLTVAPGDGMKYGQLLLRDLSGSANAVAVDIAINLDTTAPVITMQIFGR